MSDIKKLTKPLNYSNIMEGIKVGLLAFILSYLISLVVAIIFSLVFMENVNEIILGALNNADKISFGIIIKVTSGILNLSLLNTVGQLRFGILIMTIIPCLSFYFANRTNNKNIAINMNNIVKFIISSLVYTALIIIISNISKGQLVDITINFVSIRNAIMTFCITLFIQLFIGLHYKKDARCSVKATRLMIKAILSCTAVWGLIRLIRLMAIVPTSVFYKIIGGIVLFPNMVVYHMFSLMGIKGQLSESLSKIFQIEHISINMDLFTMPLGLKIFAFLVFIGMVTWILLRSIKTNFIVETLIFSGIFSVFCMFAAYATTLNLSIGNFIQDLSFGIRIVQAFIVPFIVINIIGLIIYLIRKMIAIMKEI